MPGRVLVVDDSATNRMLIRARLSAEYYEVIEAGDGEQALAMIAADPPDLVLLDLGLPGIDGLEVCRRLKSDAATAHVPVVMLTASEGRQERVRGLETGADDFLTKPFDNVALLSRVASLTRMKMMVDELALRGDRPAPGASPFAGLAAVTSFPDAAVLIVTADPGAAGRLGAAIGGAIGCAVETAAAAGSVRPPGDATPPDVVLIDAELAGADPLRLGARIRARAATRPAAILLIVPAGNTALAARALGIGFNDYIASPVDPVELVARIRLQLRRKRYADRLRETVRDSMVHAVTDPLTGVYNRRHANAHIEDVVDRSRDRGAELTIMLLDLDRFKSINDGHGHAAGDMVLREFARRLQANVRSIDLVARIGGEEFMVVMPDSGAASAAEIAERVRLATADPPFRVSQSGATRSVTVSIGYAVLQPGESVFELIERADRALYASKNAGRNRATLSDAA
ncbi:MAG TPA: PleD family two-component system response regulator [Paracoccaceae bacterium]|nr:PleD family two-component system response regulator [Paracoccaceae bacterium]